MAEAIVTPVLEGCVGAAGSAATKHLGYIWNYKKNIKNLKTQVEKLDQETADKSRSVTDAEKNVQHIKDRVKGWQKNAEEVSKDAKTIIEDHKEEGKKRCFMGLCPSFIWRYQLSKRASEKEKEIADAIREAGEIREVSDRATGLVKKTALSTEGCFTFDSRKLILEDIAKTLQDETMNSVGVYGLGGMGKTTLAKQIASQVTQEKMFEEVVFASVTQKVDMKEIQDQIASMLDLKLEDSAVIKRASLIHERLKGKKALVILDDLWENLDLKEVGIPFGAEHMGCKVLLTSRTSKVLTSMGTRKDYDLGALKEEEAWKLFEEKVSHIVKNSKFLKVGKDIVKKCAGWPILIVTTAASLSKQPNLEIWEDALAQVKDMNDTNMQDIVKSAIKSISYKNLNETHKQLFLLCGLLQGDSIFEDILRYSWGWDLFVKENVRTVEGARKRLRTLIGDLKESCLLVDGRSSDHIKMHDVVRDIAISIAKDDLKAFSVGDNDTDLSSLPNDDELNKCTAMVFWRCRKLPRFPERLECPSLEMFILSAHRVDSKPKIPDTFFERTSKLKVLDMSGLSFPTLPSTLSFLTNLQSLYLDDCHGMEDISMVGELKKLQELSLIGSTIQALPSSLGQLSELKLLDLDRCSKLKVIPAGLIKRLSKLEELHMSKSFDRWKCEEFPSNASFAELKGLPNLTCLKVKLQDANLLAGDLNFENLKRYEIIVGDMWNQPLGRRFVDLCGWFKTIGVKTIIALQLGTNSIKHLQHVVNTLFKRIECLCLGELKGINNLIPQLDDNGFPELKHLHIAKDSEIQYIVNVEGIQHKDASFPTLESLCLSGMLKVEKICNGRLMEGSFCNLTIVEVNDCNNLESLFSFSMVITLQCLKGIKVSRCKLLKQVVAREGGETKTEAIIFPQLIYIRLVDLPNLTTFCSGLVEGTTTREKVETTTQPLFDEKLQFPSLKTLYIEKLDSIKAIWPNTVGITHSWKNDSCENNLKDKLQEIPIFQNLSEVMIHKCESLKFVFSAYVAQSLNQMTMVCVQDCGMEITIGDKQGVEIEKLETGTTSFIIPKLVSIRLNGLPKLEYFHPKEHTIEWPALKDLEVADCGKVCVLDFLRKQEDDRIVKVISSLKTLRIGSKELSTLSELAVLNILDRLEELRLEKCPPLINLAPLPISFRLLKRLEIWNCGGLINLLQPSAANNLEQLESLYIAGCEIIEEIIRGEGREDDKESPSSCRDDEITFNKLLCLSLVGLPSLTHFCSSQYYTFNFPNLKFVWVEECPNMKTFCGGIVSTPQLKEAKICYRTTQILKEGLNKTLEKIYENEKVSQAQQERVACTHTFEKSKGKEVEVTEQAVEHFEKSETPRYSDPSCSNCTASSSQLCLQVSNQPDEVSDRATQVEVRTPAATVSATPSSNPIEEQAQIHDLSPEKSIVEPEKESQIRKNYNEELENKESEVCENVTTRPRKESEICDQVEAQGLSVTLPSTSSRGQFEQEIESHEKSIEELTEPIKQGQITKNVIDEVRNETGLSQETTNRSEAHTQNEWVVDTCEKSKQKEVEVSQQVVEHFDKSETPRYSDPSCSTQVKARTVSTTSSNNQFEAQAQIHDMSTEQSIMEPEKESQVLKNSIEDLTNKESEVCENVTTGPSKESETCDQVEEMDAQRLDLKPTEPSKHDIDRVGNETQGRSSFIPLIGESFRALGAQPMSSLNAEHVDFVKNASDWLCAYANKATKCLERNDEISDLKREIAERELKLRALQDENEATSSSMPSFG